MSFGVKLLTVGDFGAQMTAGQKDAARAITGGMRQAATLVKNNWRAQISGAGLSSRLGNTVRSAVYPQREDSLGPAAVIKVVGKTPINILSELESGAVISSARGRFLAIPTENVPRGPRGARLAPHALEALGGYKLRFVESRRGTKMLVADAVSAKSGKGFRPQTRGRLKQGRKVNAVVMYILVSQVTMKKRLDLMARGSPNSGSTAKPYCRAPAVTTARETALSALAATLTTAFGTLGTDNGKFVRDPEEAPEDSRDGVVIMRDGDPGEPTISLSPIQYQWDHAVFLELSAPGPNRNLTVDGLQSDLDTALGLDRTLGGTAIDCRVMGPVVIDEIATEGTETVRAATVHVNLNYVSSSPIG